MLGIMCKFCVSSYLHKVTSIFTKILSHLYSSVKQVLVSRIKYTDMAHFPL